MRPGYTDPEGRTYYRCLECGDSKRQWKAHSFVDSSGDIYCFRCGNIAELSIDAMLTLALNLEDLETVLNPDWTPPNAQRTTQKGRPTLLTKYADPLIFDADAFSMRDQFGKIVGWHTRYPNKISYNEGNRGICWPGADDDYRLVGTKDSPLVLVEGAYDVIQDNHVSVFGQIFYGTFRNTKAQHVIAWPDPDIINTPLKRKRFVDILNRANDNLCWVHGLISSDKDPDEATISQFVSLKRANEIVKYEMS